MSDCKYVSATKLRERQREPKAALGLRPENATHAVCSPTLHSSTWTRTPSQNALGLGAAQCAELTHGGKGSGLCGRIRRHLAHTTHVFTILLIHSRPQVPRSKIRQRRKRSDPQQRCLTNTFVDGVVQRPDQKAQW